MKLPAFALGAVTFAACVAPSAAPADPKFQPPPDWNDAKPYGEVWTSTEKPVNGFLANINVIRQQTTDSADGYTTAAVKFFQEKAAANGTTVSPIKRASNPVCPQSTSVLVTYTAKRFLGHDLALEQTFTKIDSYVYVATYTREITEPEDPAARASIESLCPAV